MPSIKWIVLCLLSVGFSYAYDSADTRFEVRKTSSTVLQVRVFEGQTSIFDQTVNSQSTSLNTVSKKTYGLSSCQLRKVNKGFTLQYKSYDSSSLTLFIDAACNITIPGASETNYQQGKTWGFKTPQTLINDGFSAFYQAFTEAQAFHNFGIFKALTGDFHQNYLFNRGVFHFGDETDYAGADAYLPYLLSIDQTAKSSYESGIIDDYGIILAEHGLKVVGLKHRSHTYTDVGGTLELQNASIENTGNYTVSGPITGTAQRIESHQFLSFGSMHQNTLTLGDWVNDGEVYAQSSSEIFAQNLMDNKGPIYVKGDLSIGSKKRPKSLGPVLAEGTIKAIVQEILDDLGFKEAFKGARFLSQGQKVIIDVLQHTDHYLNTITDHYTVDQFGSRRYSHRTETGYIFQRRTTEKQAKEVDVGGTGNTEVIGEVSKQLGGKCKLFQDLRDQLKDRLKMLKGANVNNKILVDAISSVLKEAGLDGDDIAAVLGDKELSDLLNAFSLYDELDSKGKNQLLQNETPFSDLLKDVVIKSQKYGLGTVKWIKQNGIEFVSLLCDAATVATTVSKHPLVLATAGVCGAGKMGFKAYKGLEKASLSFSKKYTGGKVQNQTTGSLRVTNPVKAESPIWKNLQPYKGPIKTNGKMGKEREYYRWDYTHNDIEVFSHDMKHVGSMDPQSGKIYKTSKGYTLKE